MRHGASAKHLTLVAEKAGFLTQRKRRRGSRGLSSSLGQTKKRTGRREGAKGREKESLCAPSCLSPSCALSFRHYISNQL